MNKIKLQYLLLFFLPVGSLFSCQASYGEKYVRGNLEIYFTEDCKSYVEPVAEYFAQNDLIFEQPHSIQLTSTSMGAKNPGFIMKMVQTSKESKIPASQMHQIKLLEDELKREVYSGANFTIEICDENFVVLTK